MSETATLKIWRGADKAAGRWETHDVPFERGQSVLDGLRWIRVHKDPTLAIRFSCINANACKECMVELDGETVYASADSLYVAFTPKGPNREEHLSTLVCARDFADSVESGKRARLQEIDAAISAWTWAAIALNARASPASSAGPPSSARAA